MQGNAGTDLCRLSVDGVSVQSRQVLDLNGAQIQDKKVEVAGIRLQKISRLWHTCFSLA